MNTGIPVAILICVALASTSGVEQRGQGGVSNQDVAATVPEAYRALWDGGVPSDQVQQVWAGFPYDRIDFERTACYGTCPVYRASLFKGGKAELRRIQHMEPQGEFEGRIGIHDYGKLCYLMKELGFDELPTRYTASWTDSPTVIVTVTSGSTRKVVSDYAGVGPIRLWAVQQAVDAAIDRIRWTSK